MSSGGRRSQHRQLNVEPLWSPAVATRGNRWQTAQPLKRPRQAKTGGKEGVDGSSPSEGFSKFLLISCFRCRRGRRRQVSASTERPRAGDSFSDKASNRCC